MYVSLCTCANPHLCLLNCAALVYLYETSRLFFIIERERGWGGQNIANFSCCMICDPESQKVSIIDQQSSPLNHSDKSVNKPGDTCQLAELFHSSCLLETYSAFLVKV